MTNEEAHEYLEDMQRRFTENRYCYSDTLIDANGMAILALEKQIPKKPFYTAMRVDDWDAGSILCCPECREAIHSDFVRPIRPKFCRECGQALDWSEKIWQS